MLCNGARVCNNCLWGHEVVDNGHGRLKVDIRRGAGIILDLFTYVFSNVL